MKIAIKSNINNYNIEQLTMKKFAGAPSEVHEESMSSSTSSGSPSNSDDENKSIGSIRKSPQKHSLSPPNDDQEERVTREDRQVEWVKILVGLVFITCAIAMILSVYFIAQRSDQNSFEIEYEGYVRDISALVIWEVRYNFALMEQLRSSITIASHLKNSTFPFHTEPEFEITGGFVDGMGGIMSAAFAPFVSVDQREQWEQYSVENQNWIENSAYLKAVHPVHRDALHGTIQDHEHDRRQILRRKLLQSSDTTSTTTTTTTTTTNNNNNKESISSQIFRWENGKKIVETNEPGKIFAPLWQVSPADYSAINANLMADPRVKDLYDVMAKANRAVMSPDFEIGDLFDFLFDEGEKEQKKLPHALIAVPVHKEFVESDPEVVGMLIGVTVYSNLLDRLLPEGKDGIIGVIDDSCGSVMSFELNSGKAEFLGYEDLHEPEFNSYGHHEWNIEMYEDTDIDGLCVHGLSIYPSTKFRQTFDSNAPVIYAGVVALAFLGTAILMYIYDWLVNKRQSKTAKVAARTQAIVTSLFPKEIGKQLVEEAYDDSYESKRWRNGTNAKGQGILGSLLSPIDEVDSRNVGKITKPIADLFPEATVMFGDIVGFTAWASAREPTQVFMLLEGLYSSFDKIAARRKVMKIETVGDCYVAVCGLPEPRKEHATVMVRFARDCLHQMHVVLHNLTVTLGPDTMELGIRIGLNSGPVTAGVLRGERARFQLFGDTVNTTARIESSGSKNRIHISEETANLLKANGKEGWIIPRSGKIHAKGKGEMQTYWINSSSNPDSEVAKSSIEDSTDSEQLSHDISGINIKFSKSIALRVIEWNVELLSNLLKQVIARRQAIGTKPDSLESLQQAEQDLLKTKGMPLSEVKEVIQLPKYTPGTNDIDPETIVLPPEVTAQLKQYVTSIGELYNDNPFHNFEHANHVTMSVVKLLKRIVAPTDVDGDIQNLHDHTYGITSDPLTQFSVVLAALIHDVDHSGVPNMQLIAEKTRWATMYGEKSIAEQHSVDLAWSLLMEDQFEMLRNVIYTNLEELRRFRQMVVHTVMATDIMDKEHNKRRKDRWNATFPETESDANVDNSDEVDRKATIVIEHLMQASDVAHTMQHWHVYSKWNARLFKEMYGAYKSGRASRDPSETWYEGEIGFLDYYVIPLALKLKRCGVFGVFGDEYLNYARQNRTEWEEKGKTIVRQLVEEFNAS